MIKPIESILKMWTVYDHPTDYPESYVARLFEIDGNGEHATGSIIIAPKLETLRDILCFELGLTPIARDPNDDSKIVEVWL